MQISIGNSLLGDVSGQVSVISEEPPEPSRLCTGSSLGYQLAVCSFVISFGTEGEIILQT